MGLSEESNENVTISDSSFAQTLISYFSITR